MMVVAAHPDDESLGFGAVLARYASEGVETYLVTATRGQGGRYLGHPPGSPEHPGTAKLAAIRERELHDAAAALGIRRVVVLDYEDKCLDRVDVAGAVAAIVAEVRRARPHVLLTFGPDGAYGHTDHIAVSQLTTAAAIAAADEGFGGGASNLGPAHAVSKLYYLAWGEAAWNAYQRVFKKLTFSVGGTERQATPWPEWALTTFVDTKAWWPVVQRAVACHVSQTGAYAALQQLDAAQCESFWGLQTFYRAYSLVNGGRGREVDLFEGIRRPDGG